MRKAKILFLMLALSFATALADEPKRESYDWTNVINAIIQVESKGNEKAYNPNGNCAGILQITPILVNECNRILKQKGSNKHYIYNDRYNAEKSKEMFVLFQETYNPSHNVEKAIRMWNGGPKYGKASTDNYFKKVMKYYKGTN